MEWARILWSIISLSYYSTCSILLLDVLAIFCIETQNLYVLHSISKYCMARLNDVIQCVLFFCRTACNNTTNLFSSILPHNVMIHMSKNMNVVIIHWLHSTIFRRENVYKWFVFCFNGFAKKELPFYDQLRRCQWCHTWPCPEITTISPGNPRS